MAGKSVMRSPRALHLIEPGGQGGVFQHTLEVGRRLSATGRRVIVHTASDFETVDTGGVKVCGCVNWHRSRGNGPLRKIAIVRDYVLQTVPHLRRAATGEIAHVQGLFASPLYAWTLCVLKNRAMRLVFSPHNTFSRSGRRWEEMVLRWSVRCADSVVVFSPSDAARLASWNVAAIQSPLVQHVAKVRPELVDAWRRRLRRDNDDVVLLVPGQIRRDKGISELIEAAKLLTFPVRIAVVGEDKGDLARCRGIAEQLDVEVAWVLGYQQMSDFTASILASDVVVVPYAQASQSGVLSLAAELGVPSVAYPVGGLDQYATVTAGSPDPAALAEAVTRLIQGPIPCVRPAIATHAVEDLYANF